MNKLDLPLDPCNPGQFYACCGLLDLCHFFGISTLSHFEVDVNRPRPALFVLASEAQLDLRSLLTAGAHATYETINDCEAEASVKPVRVHLPTCETELDWWLDDFRQKPSSFKCWAGQVTSAKLFKELPRLIDVEASTASVFLSARASKSKFGVDPRSAWNALDFGYSPNEQGQDAATFPAVEILAGFGLQTFRPPLTKRDNVCFHLWRKPLPRLAAMQAAAGGWPGASLTSFQFSIAKRGQSYKFFTPAKPYLEKDNYGS